MKNKWPFKWSKKKRNVKQITNKSLTTSAKSMRERTSGFSRILFNRRLKNIWVILIRKSYTTNNTFKKNYLLKTSKKKEKETKKETLIKTFNIKFTKNKSKKERCKCKNNKKINKLKKLRRRITSLSKMREVMKSLRNWVIGRNWINRWINSTK